MVEIAKKTSELKARRETVWPLGQTVNSAEAAGLPLLPTGPRAQRHVAFRYVVMIESSWRLWYSTAQPNCCCVPIMCSLSLGVDL